MKKKNKKHKKHNKKRIRRKLSKREKRIMRVKRSLKKGAKKLRLSAKRTGAYVFGTLRKIFGNPYTKYGVMLTDVKLLGTGLELKKGERVGYIRATNIPGGGVFVRPIKLHGIWKMASRDDSIYIRPGDMVESIRTTKMSGAPLRDNSGARYRVGGGYQTFTLEEAKKEADRIFRQKGIIVSIEEHKAIPQVKPDWKYGIYTGRGIARNPIKVPQPYTIDGGKAYLSHTDGMWRVIWKGLPLNADTPDRKRAEAVAKHYKVKLAENLIWTENGWVFDIKKNPPMYAHHLTSRRTHGLNLRKMMKLYRLVRAGNRKAVMYARRVLGIPMSETLSQVAAVVYHHINDLKGKK